ncbi:hypothetical protein D7X94_17805 [Acutalibacter sp. 1XD8-33]|uniref:hypothetical protein n=1 Tax=Acutalibacter sp. 1XD8-33 TaxID=2320081 RepID=UPI000EA26AF2|nr:hypothetical protein [Acutalibacter sp. 1XD8-33]RKJ38023.1 hypothetical protein D7X94_17805 [Acutalibacter sp. 1XD8-33]
MADLSPAEILLDSLVPAQQLIRRLQDLLKAPVSYGSIRLSPEAKAARAAFQSVVQHNLDKLIAQREKGVALVKLIPDTTARTVIKLRYGLVGSGCEKMPHFKIGEMLHYSDKTIFRYHQKGIDQLNQLLEGEKA